MKLGSSRAVLVLTDLALVDKKTKDGTLIFVCDARTGAPVPGAKVEALEVWSNWVRKERRRYHAVNTTAMAASSNPGGPDMLKNT